ncbi:hypothetical protein ACPEH7_02965 [Stenotrophomonas sp. NPDC101269]|uniref:hypothetical protein n=1 Tax=Stenotrophomonas sp. NPDC101269 TaxID=3415003 RepID=UPI003C303906
MLHGLALLVVGPWLAWLLFGLLIRFEQSPVSLGTIPFTWAYYLGITAIPMLLGLILIGFVRPLFGWIIYALGSAFMLYWQVTLSMTPTAY